MTGSMFLASICREIFSRVDVAESMRNPVRLYVDEAESTRLSNPCRTASSRSSTAPKTYSPKVRGPRRTATHEFVRPPRHLA
jgi:hypothetical protein